jgi:hypothetical protein
MGRAFDYPDGEVLRGLVEAVRAGFKSVEAEPSDAQVREGSGDSRSRVESGVKRVQQRVGIEEG